MEKLKSGTVMNVPLLCVRLWLPAKGLAADSSTSHWSDDGEDVALLEYQHHSRDYASHLPPGSIMQPQRRRPSLLSEFQPGNERSQELHLRTEAHPYISDLAKPSDLEFIETKRPRLDLLQDPLMRHSPLLSQSQQGGTEDLAKDRGLPGKLEPVSPVSPAHPDSELDLLPARLSKEELIQNMDRVDREITMVEQQISKLKKKQPGRVSVRGQQLCGYLIFDKKRQP
nr:PREDICTED: nuclear receptor corepressor 2-like [Apteryx mantelli mantelli]